MKFWIVLGCLTLVFWLESVFPLFQDSEHRHRLRHAGRNLALALINGLVLALIFSSLTLKTIEASSWGLLDRLDWNPAAEFMIAFLLFDCWMYVWHRANHRIPFLWRFHRVHHSDMALDSTSALRFHTGEIIYSSLIRLVIVPLIGMSWQHLMIYEICLQPVIIFHHSNIALPEKIDRILRAVIVTPNMHRVHHSQIRDETDSNYSSIFSWWDRLAVSFRKRQDTRTIQYGLPYFQEEAWQDVTGLLKTPFAALKPEHSP